MIVTLSNLKTKYNGINAGQLVNDWLICDYIYIDNT